MPQVLPLGVGFDEFWTLNPHKVNILIKAFNERQKNEIRKQNMLAHLQGQYVAEALMATVGNMFRGRGQKAYEYPDEPYTLSIDYEEDLNIENEDERDIALKRAQFVANLNRIFGEIEETLEEKNAGY